MRIDLQQPLAGFDPVAELRLHRSDQRAAAAVDQIAFVAAAEHIDPLAVHGGQVEDQLDRRGLAWLDAIFGAAGRLHQLAHPGPGQLVGVFVEIEADGEPIEFPCGSCVILVQPVRIEGDLCRDRSQGVGERRNGQHCTIGEHHRAVRLALAVDQADPERRGELVHVVMVGIDELAANLHRHAACRALGEHASAEPRPRLVDAGIDPCLGQMPQGGQPGDAATDDRHRPPDRRGAQRAGHGSDEASRTDRFEQGAAAEPLWARHRRFLPGRRQIHPARRFERLPESRTAPHSAHPPFCRFLARVRQSVSLP
ncbi:hypothetical protein MGWOODY_Smn2126 [hydrothermal vent metagenome]|uniref:Uncharacterized protein n=1 Tax=hydrothermal vent metagenome TaxID=652676 RepID=A0A160TK66_9ZZZZ